MKTTTLAIASLALLASGAAVAQDFTAGSLLVRARAVYLDSANKDSTGLDLSINNKTLPEVDFTYFFSPNLAAELVLTVPQKQRVYAGATQIGSLKHLPPTLTLQYHFNQVSGIKPYVGAGVNYTRFSSVDCWAVAPTSSATAMASHSRRAWTSRCRKTCTSTST